MRISLAVLLALASTASADPSTDVPDLAAARKLVAETATCVPKPKKDGPSLSLHLATVDGAPTLCAEASDEKPPWGPVGCWTVDVAKKKLVPVAPRVLLGEAIRTQLVKGCAYGLCLPKGEKLPKPDDRVDYGINDAGDLAMLFTFNDTHEFATAYIFDRAKKTFLRKAEVKPGTSMVKTVLVKDKVVVMSVPAGPAAEFTIWETVPSKSKKVADDEEYPKASDVDIYRGGFWLVAPNELLAASAGFHHVERIDETTGKSTVVRKRKPSACLKKEMDDPGAQLKCSTKGEVSPYENASIIATPTGYLAVLSGTRAGEIVSMTDKLAEKKLFNAYCTK